MFLSMLILIVFTTTIFCIALVILGYTLYPINTMLNSKAISYPYYYTSIDFKMFFNISKWIVVIGLVVAGVEASWFIVEFYYMYKRRELKGAGIIILSLLAIAPLIFGLIIYPILSKFGTIIHLVTSKCLVKTLNSNGTILYIYNKTCVLELAKHVKIP